VPPNTGAYSAQFQPTSYSEIYVNTPANLSGLVFNTAGYADYDFYASSGGTLTIGNGGITATGGSNYSYVFLNLPVVLSASQTWGVPSGSSFIEYYGSGISETGGSQSLTTNGYVYMYASNTFSGGLMVASGTFYAGTSSAAGTGTITFNNGSTLAGYDVILSNAVTLGSNVSLGSYGQYGYGLTLSGPVTATSSATTVNILPSSSVSVTGAVSGPSSTMLTITGNGAQLPYDGGSQLVFQGTLNNVTGLDVENAALILAPTGSVASSFSGLTALQVGNGPLGESAYLGLDGTFATTSGAVSGFLTAYGPSLGPVFKGTLGFDTVAFSSSSPNSFSDPIDLSNFTSPHFLGLGSETTAILAGTITPAGNNYVFGGGGGTLTVQSALSNNGTIPRTLTMSMAPEPLTLYLDGSNTYMGGTQVNGGILIFASPPPTSGMISLYNGYVGYTEGANITSAQTFVNLFQSNTTSGVIGFDSGNPSSPRTIADSINLSGFSSGNNPFIGTATEVTLDGTITPVANQYQFTGVKGGQLTINSQLSDLLTTGSNSVVVGLSTPIEANGTVSVVTLGGSNTYSGGTTLNSGILYVTNPNSLGTGALTVQNSYSSVLAPLGGSVTLGNNIFINSRLQLGQQNGNSNLLTLNGIISGSGSLDIESNVALNGANTSFTGSTEIGNYEYAVSVAIGNLNALGTGPVTLDNNSTLTENIPNPTIVDLTSDDNYYAPTINLAPSSTLTLYTDSNYTSNNWANYSGSINGDASSQVIKTGPGVAFLNGTSTYGGGTSVGAGVLIAGGSAALGTGTVTVANGAELDAYNGVLFPNSLNLAAGSILGGTGTFSSAGGATFASGATVAPGYLYAGQYIGALSFANVTFGTGGIFDFDIQNAGGIAGADYSTLNASGTLTISATQGSPFQISVTSIDPSTGAPGMATFNPNRAYSWTLVNAGSISGFNSLDFSVNASGFQNSLNGGSFLISENGGALDLNFTPVPEPSTFILMLAGIAAIGTRIRRSKRL
jgi:autotransporter-associated beta strand protein